MSKEVIEVHKDSGCSCGCFGCLLEVIGLLGFIYLIAHWSQIWNLVLH